MLLLLSITFFAIFLGMQYKAVKEKLLERSLEGMEHAVLILGCFLAILYNNEMFIGLQDIVYGYTWNLGLEYKSLLFYMSFIAFAIKNESDSPERAALFGVKEIAIVVALFLGLVSSSILVWSVVLLILLSMLKLNARDRLLAQALPFLLILTETYSASSLSFLTYDGIDKYETVYRSITLSCLLSIFFMFGSMILLAKRNVDNLKNSLCLGGYILLYSKVSTHFNTEDFFSLFILLLTGLWLYNTLRQGGVIETCYRQSKQIMFLVVFLVLVGVTGSFVSDSLYWSAVILLSNTLLMQNYDVKQEFSVLVTSKRILSTILFAMVSLVGISALIYSSRVAISGANVIFMLCFALACWQLLLRLNYSHRYDLKSELFSDFSSAPFVISLGLAVILLLALIYQIASTHFVSIIWFYALVIPSGFILIANVFKKLNEVERRLSFLYSLNPDSFVSQITVGLKECQSGILCFFKVFVRVVEAFFETIKNIFKYLSYISDAVLEKSLKYKVHAIFIIWIVLISFVTSWSL